MLLFASHVLGCVLIVSVFAGCEVSPRTRNMELLGGVPFQEDLGVEQLVARRMPVLVNATAIIRSWTALDWTPETISKRVSPDRRLLAFLKGNVADGLSSDVFMFYNEEQPLATIDWIQWRAPNRKERMPVSAIMDMLVERPTEVYFTAGMESLPELQRDITDVAMFAPLDTAIFESASTSNQRSAHGWTADERDPDPVVWIGSGGVTAQMHYDRFHNFFIQLSGTKTFFLAAPSEIKSVHVYPSLHPSNRQSQVDFQRVNFTRFPLFERVPVLKVLLGPGDVLYVPPFWLHRVVAEVASVSVSVWSPSFETAQQNFMEEQPIPLEEEWGQDKVVAALKLFFEEIAEQYAGPGGRPVLLHSLLHQRWRPLLLELYVPVPQSGSCHTDGILEPSEREKIVDRAARVASVLRASTLSIPNGQHIAEQSFYDYVEKVADVILGTEIAVWFIKDCLLAE